MFENTNETERSVEQSRSRVILWGGTIVILLLATLVILVARSRPNYSVNLENAVRTGSAEFEAYRAKVEVEVTDKLVYDNVIGMFQIDIRARIHNRGERPITGLEIVGKMFDMDDKVIAQRISIPIPRGRKEPLQPGESIPVRVKVDAPAKITENDVKDVAIELQALKFQ